jgi:hypothetical protein
MATRVVGEAPTKKKARFTVSDAARAFRQARGTAEKIERIEGEKRFVRRDETGRFVLVNSDEPSASRRKAARASEPGTTRGRLKR